MQYTFKLEIYTDSDFSFPYIPIGMKYGIECYSLEKDFKNKEAAVKYIKDISEFLKTHITGDKYAIESFKSMLERFCKNLEDKPNNHFHSCVDYMGGNYEGTSISLEQTLNKVYITELFLTDEEYDLYKSAKYLSLGDIKDAVLEKCKEIKEKYKHVNY